VWKFAGGPGTVGDFGDPLGNDGTSYALCLYDATVAPPATIGRVVIPAGGQCGTMPCWKATGTLGFKYKRKDGAPEGAVGLVLKAGTSVKATLKAKGSLLANRVQPVPATPLGSPPLPALRAQLRARNGQCWEAEYPAAIVNQPGKFKAKAATPVTTSTTTTSTTSTSTTTTTLTPACGDAAFPQCDGTCPNIGEYCEGSGFDNTCFCRSYACGWAGAPDCWGECAPGGVCADDGGGGCMCEPGSQPCGSATFPECDGTCGPLEECFNDGSGGCHCDSLACGLIGGVGFGSPQCWGECPAGEVCRDFGSSCACTP